MVRSVLAASISPEPGDISVCINCGHIMAFADDLKLRSLTDQEMFDVAGDPRMLLAQRAIAETKVKKGEIDP